MAGKAGRAYRLILSIVIAKQQAATLFQWHLEKASVWLMCPQDALGLEDRLGLLLAHLPASASS